ncbi:hypothetical protein AAMO2058_000671900 [Amorphochlora amoebiformis]
MSWKKTRHDKYYALAKEQGYRSRAAFKLIQINKKFDFLSKAKSLLDLCAAPGGWLQVAQKFMPAASLIIGIDILPIRPIRGVVCLKHDITTQQCRTAIKREAHGWDFDVVVHDGAPNVGGSTWAKDAYGQSELVLHSLKLATEFLRPGGTFATKIFRSQDYNALVWVLNKFFRSVTITKPASSRNASAEIFAVCEGFLAPKKIDPRLLDPQHVFKQVEDVTATEPDVFHRKEKRHREGYEEGTTLLYKEIGAAEFIESESPVDMLGKFNAFTFKSAKDKALKQLEVTSEEIELCCMDLRVLGKKDFSNLLKWRLKVRKIHEEEKEAKEETKSEENKEEEKELTQEELMKRHTEKIEKEMETLNSKLAKHEKKLKRRRRLQMLKTKSRIKSTQGLIDDDDMELHGDLFHLDNIRDPTMLMKIAAGEGAIIDEDEDADSENNGLEVEDSDDDMSEEEKRMIRLAEEMDAQYEEYRKRRGIPERKRGRSSASKTQLDPEDYIPGEDEFNLLADTRLKVEEEEEDREVAEQENPLLVPIATEDDVKFDQKEKEMGRETRWFDRPLFKDDDSDDGRDDESKPTLNPKKTGKSSSEVKKSTSRPKKSTSEPKSSDKKALDPSESRAKKRQKNEEEEEEESEDFGGFTLGGVTTPYTAAHPSDGKGEGSARDNEDEEFEEVAIEDDWSSDSDARAEALAVGKLMIRKKEAQYNVRMLPVTKEQVAEARAQLMSINARPIKKVAEAKYRKKIQALKKMKKATQKAEGILNDESVPDGEKVKGIEKLIKKAAKRNKKDRIYVVSKRGAGGKEQTRNAIRAAKRRGGRVKLVDRRMKADMHHSKGASKKARRGKGKGKKRKR